jgi:cobalamin biosynthesis protein CobD/CbiB
MGLGKALMFLGFAFVILLSPGLYMIYPYQISLIVKVILQSYLLVFLLALYILAKGIGRVSSWLKEAKLRKRRDKIKIWEIQTLENYYS